MTAKDALAIVHQILWPESWGGEWQPWQGEATLQAIAAVVTTAESAGHIKPTTPHYGETE
jgi:hypothetical protein